MKKALHLISILSLSAMLLASSMTYAADINPNLQAGGSCSSLTTDGLNGVFSCLVGLMNNLVVLMIAGAVVYIVYGAFNMIRSEEKRESGRQTVVYGIIGLFVMISVWGLVNIQDVQPARQLYNSASDRA